MTSFRTLVTSHPGLAEELPLIHTSRCEFLSNIAATHSLEPQPCGVFHESLVYLFYGRPAYRSNKGSKGGEPIALCPVCFVFKPRTVSQAVRRIFPCDTGAVVDDRFNPELQASDLAQLALDPQIDSARRFVSLMFERNSDYFVGKVVTVRSFMPGSVEARFYELLMRDGPVDYDDRKSAIEVQVNQAIARVNRTCGQKKCGYVVDYIGVARHLNEALKEYDGEDTKGTLIDISVELPKLLDRRARAVAVLTDYGITDLQGQVDACVELLEDLKMRADFINKLRMFYETLNILEHRPEVPSDVFRDAKLLGFINKVAANLYRDPALNLLGVAEKVKALINAHVSARGVDPKIPPTTITDAEFERVLQGQTNSRARAAQMQHAARYHIIGFSHENPAYARKMSEKLEEILRRFKDDWDALERELRQFIEELRQGDRNEFPDLDPKVQVPFVRLVLEECSKERELNEAQRTAALAATLDMVERIRQEVRKVGFWKNSAMRELLTRALVRDLDQSGVCPAGKERDLAQRLVALAKENHENLTRP